MNLIRRVAVYSAAMVLAAGVAVVINPGTALAHGAMMKPGARTYNCWVDGLNQNGAIQPNNPACAAAVAQGGTTPLYNWFGVLRSDAGGRTTGFISDGQLCSGGNPTFSAYDLPRGDWPLTHLTSGANMDWWYSNWAAHPGTWYMYVTKNGFNPNSALKWSDLEATPFLTITNPPAQGAVGTNDGHYYWSGNLPSGKSGQHIIYSRWVRSDSQENFFGCSDVVFDGGNGQVTGIGPGQGTQNPPSSAAPTSRPPSSSVPTTRPPSSSVPTTRPPSSSVPTTRPPSSAPPTSSGGGGACTATYAVVGSWGNGFQGSVTVRAGSASISSWTATWANPSGVTITQVWNGTGTASGSNYSVKNVSYNGSVPAGGTTSFGFLGSGTSGTPTVTCTSP